MAWLGLISYGIFLWHYVFTLKLGYGGEGWDSYRSSGSPSPARSSVPRSATTRSSGPSCA